MLFIKSGINKSELQQFIHITNREHAPSGVADQRALIK